MRTAFGNILDLEKCPCTFTFMHFLVGFTASHSRFMQEVWFESSDCLKATVENPRGSVEKLSPKGECRGCQRCAKGQCEGSRGIFRGQTRGCKTEGAQPPRFCSRGFAREKSRGSPHIDPKHSVGTRGTLLRGQLFHSAQRIFNSCSDYQNHEVYWRLKPDGSSFWRSLQLTFFFCDPQFWTIFCEELWSAMNPEPLVFDLIPTLRAIVWFNSRTRGTSIQWLIGRGAELQLNDWIEALRPKSEWSFFLGGGTILRSKSCFCFRWIFQKYLVKSLHDQCA